MASFIPEDFKIPRLQKAIWRNKHCADPNSCWWMGEERTVHFGADLILLAAILSNGAKAERAIEISFEIFGLHKCNPPSMSFIQSESGGYSFERVLIIIQTRLKGSGATC